MCRGKSWLLAGAGLVLGLAIGGAMVTGVLLGQRSAADPKMAALDELRLKALATHGAETFAVATGPVDDSTEGLFCLDYLTGDLQVFVLSSRQPGQLAGWFKTNITTTLTPDKGKKPSYLLVTGQYSVQGGSTGTQRPASSICYVVDSNTGAFAAYGFLWSKSAAGYNASQAGEMRMVYAGKARNLEIRE
jgi:hypothetical protein